MKHLRGIFKYPKPNTMLHLIEHIKHTCNWFQAKFTFLAEFLSKTLGTERMGISHGKLNTCEARAARSAHKALLVKEQTFKPDPRLGDYLQTACGKLSKCTWCVSSFK